MSCTANQSRQKVVTTRFYSLPIKRNDTVDWTVKQLSVKQLLTQDSTFRVVKTKQLLTQAEGPLNVSNIYYGRIFFMRCNFKQLLGSRETELLTFRTVELSNFLGLAYTLGCLYIQHTAVLSDLIMGGPTQIYFY